MTVNLAVTTLQIVLIDGIGTILGNENIGSAFSDMLTGDANRTGSIVNAQFALSTDVASATDRIILDVVTGTLIYDSNSGGAAHGGQTKFSAIDINLARVLAAGISASDILII